MLIIWLYKACCSKFLTTVLCRPWHLECLGVVQTSPTFLSKPQPRRSCCQHIRLLILRSRVRNIHFSFSQTFFADDHMWECRRRDCMGHAPNLHKGQVHVLVYTNPYRFSHHQVKWDRKLDDNSGDGFYKMSQTCN